jgi:hypothetical protein
VPRIGCGERNVHGSGKRALTALKVERAVVRGVEVRKVGGQQVVPCEMVVEPGVKPIDSVQEAHEAPSFTPRARPARHLA